MRRVLPPLPVLPLLALLLLSALPGAAYAKLEGAEWKQAETEFARLFTPPPGRLGFKADKLTLIELLLKDGEARSLRMLGDALVGECTLWLEARKAVHEKEDLIFPVLKKATKDRTPDEEQAMFAAQKELGPLEEAATLEREVLDALVAAIGAGPAALKANLYGRAKAAPDWNLRAAVAQVAATQPTDKDASAFLSRVLNPSSEKDPRVRAAALEALKGFPDGAEEHVLGRLADPDWTVQLTAVRLVRAQKSVRAVPHLITVLERANPRMQEEIGTALREVTGQNFDPYADVWAKWWEANKEKFQAKEAVKVGARPANPPQDPTLYGVPIKSDRVLFVIDVSGSMRESIKVGESENAKPAPAVTPKEGVPAPPAPHKEDHLSGPKVNVAVDQVKRAIDKLGKGATFAMIAFNHATMVWKDRAVPATPENKEEAFKWLRQWRWEPGPDYAKDERVNGKGSPGPSGSTYVEGALRLALTRIAGLGTVDKAYPEVAIDTIMFLCDGAPTDNAPTASNLVPTDPILAKVREWNARGAVVIHAIAIDMTNQGGGNEFMRKLAEQNKGTFTPIPRPGVYAPPEPAAAQPPKAPAPPAPAAPTPPAPAPQGPPK